MESVLIAVGLLQSACHIQDHVEYLRSHLSDGRLSGGNGTGGNIDHVKPVILHFIAAANLDDGADIQAVGSSPAGHEYLKADSAGHLAGAADNIAGRGRRVDEAPLRGLLRRRKHLHNGACAALGNGAHGLFHDICQTALLVAGGRIGIPAHTAGCQIVIIPLHLFRQPVTGLGIRTPGRQHLNAVPDFGNLAEHHSAAAPDDHVRGVAGAGIGRNSAEGIAAAALHTDDQFGKRQLLPHPSVQILQFSVSHFQNGVHHGIMARPVLERQDVLRCNVLGRKHPVVGQLLAAKAHHHDLTAEVGVTDQIGDGTDGNGGHGCIDGNTAAIGMGNGHHTVHIGILGEQFLFDPFHRHLQHTGGTLDGGHDAQQIPGTGRTDLILIAHPGGSGRLGEFFHGDQVGSVGQVLYGRAFGQIQHMLIDPASRRNSTLGIAQRHTVADNIRTGRNIHQRDLMGLGDRLPGLQAGEDLRAGFQVVNCHSNIIDFIDFDCQTAHRKSPHPYYYRRHCSG